MLAHSDILLSVRNLKNRLLRWRLAFFVMLTVCFVLLTFDSDDIVAPGSVTTSPVVARVFLKGIIREDAQRSKLMHRIAESGKYSAVILHINSPGGSAVASETLYHEIKHITETKPVVVLMGDVALSGGYMAALAGDHIMAHAGTITGSIGVLIQSFKVKDLLNRIGVEPFTVKSSKLKGTPSPFEDSFSEADAVLQEVVNSGYEFFAGLVGERRALDSNEVLRVADGRVFAAKKALELKLIDSIGNEMKAIEWLRQEKNVKHAVRDIKPEHERFVDRFVNHNKNFGRIFLSRLGVGAWDASDFAMMYLGE